MLPRTVSRLVGTAVLAGLVACAQAAAPPPQASAAPMQTETRARSAAEALEMWERIADMLVQAAENFPEEKYDYKPVPDVRSFREQLLHAASANYFFIRLAGGEKTKPAHTADDTKAQVVAVLKESFADGAALIRKLGDAGMGRQVKHPFAEHMISLHRLWTMAAAHDGEHYGQLVVYYRLNGLVPPATQQEQAERARRKP